MPLVLPLTAMPGGLGDCGAPGARGPHGEKMDEGTCAQGWAHLQVTHAQDGPAAAQAAWDPEVRDPVTGALATAGEQPARSELTRRCAAEAENSALPRVMPTRSLRS